MKTKAFVKANAAAMRESIETGDTAQMAAYIIENAE